MFEKIAWWTAIAITTATGLLSGVTTCIDVLQTFYILRCKLAPRDKHRSIHKIIIISILMMMLAVSLVVKKGWLGLWLVMSYFAMSIGYRAKVIERNQEFIDKAEGRK